MNAKLTLTTILFAIVLNSYGQKIRIKDGIILKDKEPVAKLEGVANLDGAHLNIKSLNDEQLINIDEKTVSYGSHFQRPSRYVKITFTPFNQTVSRLDLARLSEKNIIGSLYDKIGKDFLTKEGLNKDMVSAYTSSNDESQKVHEDTTKIGAIVSGYLNGLKQSPPSRNLNARPEFSSFSEDKLKWDGYVGNTGYYFDRSVQAIYQNSVMIGVLVKSLEKGAMNAPDYNSATYYVLRKIKPFEVNGKPLEYAPLALLKTSSDGAFFTQFTIENEGRRTPPKIADFKNAELILLETLIKEGLL